MQLTSTLGILARWKAAGHATSKANKAALRNALFTGARLVDLNLSRDARATSATHATTTLQRIRLRVQVMNDLRAFDERCRQRTIEALARSAR